MPVERSNSISQNKKLSQLNEVKKSSRIPLATSPILNQLKRSENIQNLSISDCSCPICLEILVEPVVLPCKHELCLPCFKDMMDQTNFLCPMCRMRLSTWARSAAKQNMLVNQERWQAIQRSFSTEIRNRVEGKTAMLLQEEINKEKENKTTHSSKSSHQIVAANGEIKKEFEELVKREEERLRLEKEKEEQLSLQYIQEIIQREEACTFSQYINVLKAKEPTTTTRTVPIVKNEQLPTTSANSNIATISMTATEDNQHQPFITPSIPSRSTAINNRLLNKVKAYNTLENTTPVASTSSFSSSSTSIATSDHITPSYGLRSRASMKRNIDEVKNIRTNLLNTLTENKETRTVNEDGPPKAKRILKNNLTSNDSIIELSINGSHQDITTDIIIDSKLPVTSAASSLVRKRSVRVKKNW